MHPHLVSVDGWTDRTDRTDGRIGRTDGWTGEQMDGWMDAWTDRTDGWMDGWTDGQMGGHMDGQTDGWMGGWTDGRMDRWTEGPEVHPSIHPSSKIPARQGGDGRAAVDVELSKRCFQVTRTVKFAKMAKKLHSDSAKTPGLRATPPRMPELQPARKKGDGAHFRIMPLFLRTIFFEV